MTGIEAGDILWEPSSKFVAASNLLQYQTWLKQRTGREFSDYNDLWEWSVADIAEFWATIWNYFQVGPQQEKATVLPVATMPGAQWFDGGEVNFAEQVFRARRDGPAIIAYSESKSPVEISWPDLEAQVGAVAAWLRTAGVVAGDTVVGYLPNIAEAVIAFLASGSIGAIWSCCPPDFGPTTVLERFNQIEPKVLFAVNSYRYAGKEFDRSEVVAALRTGIPSLSQTVIVHQPANQTTRIGASSVSWEDVVTQQVSLETKRFPFMHPLWVLYTSGTTGPPKALVHGHGGIVLEYLKNIVLANDRKPADRVLWFTSTGWVLWNILIGNLLAGAAVVLYDGSPIFPDPGVLWRLASRTRATVLGCSPALIERCMKSGFSPKNSCDLSTLRGLSASGAPLSPEASKWTYENVRDDIWLVTGSGGTDVASSFVGASPFMPVRAGQIPARLLGVDVHAYDENGSSVIDKMGELVIRQPMPSMPLFIWGDESDARYRSTYFDQFPGVWRHGDWVTITKTGAVVIHGRSDATLKRRGVRLGTGEIYRVVEAMPEIADSLVTHLTLPDGADYLLLFVVAEAGVTLDEDLKRLIAIEITQELSPRFAPDDVVGVAAIPRTLTGKKIEVPIKRILLGEPPDRVVSVDSLMSPSALDEFIELARQGLPRLGSAPKV